MLSNVNLKGADLEEELKLLWQISDDMHVEFLGSGLYTLDVENNSLRSFLIYNAPWCVRGTCMAVKGWEENIQPKKIDFSNLQFWVQIYNLPLESITERNGFDLGRRIGAPVEADTCICFNDLGPFLRVKIGLNSRNPLPLEICFRMKSGEIGYLPIKIENLGSFCFQCGKIGHERMNCYMRSNFNPKIVVNLKNKKYSGALRGFTPKFRALVFPHASTNMHDNLQSHDLEHAEENKGSECGIEEQSVGVLRSVDCAKGVGTSTVESTDPSMQRSIKQKEQVVEQNLGAGLGLAGHFIFQAREEEALRKGKDQIPNFKNSAWYNQPILNNNSFFTLFSPQASPKTPISINLQNLTSPPNTFSNTPPKFSPTKANLSLPQVHPSTLHIKKTKKTQPNFYMKISDSAFEDCEIMDDGQTCQMEPGDALILHPLKQNIVDANFSEESSDEETPEYYYNFRDTTKKRIRVTVMETTQTRISKRESPFKKVKKFLNEGNLKKHEILEISEVAFLDCNTFFFPDADEEKTELDLTGKGFGDNGYKAKRNTKIQRKQSLGPSKRV